MTPKEKRRQGRGTIDLVEEAIHLLRNAPSEAWMAYVLGTLPFVLGLLYYWTDMSKSPFAAKHVAGSAFGMSLLYIWMKSWQSVFAARLHAHIGGAAPPKFAAARIRKLVLSQLALQPYS